MIWVWLDWFFASQDQTNSPERRYEGFGLNSLVAEEQQSVFLQTHQFFLLTTTTTVSVFQTQRNSSCWEEQESLSSRNTESLSCRNTQYWGRPKSLKLSRNGSRMDDMRNWDRENDRTGPRSIFRPLPDPKKQNNGTQIYKNVWGHSLGLFLCVRIMMVKLPQMRQGAR